MADLQTLLDLGLGGLAVALYIQQRALLGAMNRIIQDHEVRIHKLEIYDATNSVRDNGDHRSGRGGPGLVLEAAGKAGRGSGGGPRQDKQGTVAENHRTGRGTKR